MSKSPCPLLHKKLNFNENKTESKMENLTHSFRDTNLVLQLTEESRIKSKIVMSWSSRKKSAFFVTFPGVPCSKPLGGSKDDSAFHPSEADKMNTRNFWELSGKE